MKGDVMKDTLRKIDLLKTKIEAYRPIDQHLIVAA